MNKLLLACLLSSMVLPAAAQQKPQYSQYMINSYLINPAITGIEDYADVKLGHRNQWLGVEGAPVTYYVSAHTPLGRSLNLANPTPALGRRQRFNRYMMANNKYKKVKPHHGLGAMALVDKIGPFSRTEAYLTYAYHILLSQEVKLAAGVSAGMIQHLLNADELVLARPDDALTGGTLKATKPDFGAGLWLYAPDYYLGASAGQLLGNTFSFGGDALIDQSKLYSHYFLTGGYKITPSEKFALIPSVLVKWVRPAPVSVDVNLRFNYAERLWGGVSWRQSEGFVWLAGATLSHLFDIGYSFDTGVRGISRMSGGTHEIILGIRLHNRFKVLCPQNMW